MIFVQLFAVSTLQSTFFKKIEGEETILCKQDELYKSYAGPKTYEDLAIDYINFIGIDDAFILKTEEKQFDDCEKK